MRRETEISLIEQLLQQHESRTTAMAPEEGQLAVSLYTSPARYEAEQRVLFRRRPVIVAHSSEVRSAGDFLTHDALGVPLLVGRDWDGVLRAFLNVCRHRGSRVVAEERGAGRKAWVCGYHGWTYGLDGALLHIPHEEGFPRKDCDRGLVPLAVEDRGGFIWVMPTPGVAMNAGDFLGPLSDEIGGLGVDQHVVHRSASVRRKFNWKLVIDAFLDGYHLRQLHRNSVYRFFIDNVNVVESFGPHIRSIVARKGLERARDLPQADWHFRDFMSLTYFLFPNTVLVFHPDWVSRITLFPVGIDETIFTHTMLVPQGADSEEQRTHREKTWQLIHCTVFEQEDLVAAESIQSGLRSGANDVFSLGRYEFPIQLFHQQVEQALKMG